MRYWCICDRFGSFSAYLKDREDLIEPILRDAGASEREGAS